MITNRDEISSESNDGEGELEIHQKTILALIRSGSLNDLILFVELGNYSLKDQSSTGIFLPVHTAAWYGQFDIIKWLINEKHCQHNQADFLPESGWMTDLTPLCLAMKAGHANMVKRIIDETNYEFDEKNKTALANTALEDGNLDFLKWLVASKFIILKDEEKLRRDKTQHPLVIAISKNYLSLVKWLVDEQRFQLYIDSSKPLDHFLTWVLSFGHTEIAQWLLDEKGFSLNERYYLRKIVFFAIRQNHLHILQWLLNNNFRLPSHSLLYAIKKGQYEISQWLVGQNFNLLRTDAYKRNALSLACSNGSLYIVKWLIDEKGFSLDATDENNEYPLLLACRNGSIELVKWLVEVKKCSLTIEDDCNRGVVICAIISGQLDLIKYLVNEKGCSLNVKSKSNGTHPIHYAIYHNRLEVLKWLVDEKKCDLEQTTDKGDNVLSLCNINYTSLALQNWLLKEKSVCTNKNIRDSLFAFIDSSVINTKYLTSRMIDHLLLNSDDLNELKSWLHILDNRLTRKDIDWIVKDRNKVYKHVIKKFKSMNSHFYKYTLNHFCEINKYSIDHIKILLQENILEQAIELMYILIDDSEVNESTKCEAKITLAEILFQGVVDVDEENSPLNINDQFLLDEMSIRKRALQAFYLLECIDTLESNRIKNRLHNILSGNQKVVFCDYSQKNWMPKAMLYYTKYSNYKANQDSQTINHANQPETSFSEEHQQTESYTRFMCGQLFQPARNKEEMPNPPLKKLEI